MIENRESHVLYGDSPLAFSKKILPVEKQCTSNTFRAEIWVCFQLERKTIVVFGEAIPGRCGTVYRLLTQNDLMDSEIAPQNFALTVVPTYKYAHGSPAVEH